MFFVSIITEKNPFLIIINEAKYYISYKKIKVNKNFNNEKKIYINFLFFFCLFHINFKLIQINSKKSKFTSIKNKL